MSRFKTYWVWLDGKEGVLPHQLSEEIAESSIMGLTWGHSFGSWPTALSYLRECMKEGWVCRVYEVGQ